MKEGEIREAVEVVKRDGGPGLSDVRTDHAADRDRFATAT